MRRTVLLIASVAVAIILLGWGGSRAELQAQSEPPNIIFVFTDDQDKDTIRHMPFVQNTLIPNGTKFPNATFNRPLCCPSRASMLRGQYTHNHDIWQNTAQEGGGYQKFLASGFDGSNFPVWLNRAGYQTGGFGLYVNEYDPAVHGTPTGFDFFRHYSRNWNNARIPVTEHRDRYVKDNAVRWLEENVSGPPLMMWVSFHAPHGPFEYDPIYEGRFDDVELPKGPAFNEEDVSDKPQYIQNLRTLSEPAIAQREENHRDRLRASLTPDEAVRQLRNTVQNAGELENTYIVFWTDNGYMMGEHRLSGKSVPYVESASFPMVVRGPGVPRGAEDERVVMNQDLAPTFAELAGVPIPEFVDGRSMVPILDGGGPWRHVGLIEAPPPLYPQQSPAYRGLRAEDYTYVEYASGEKEYYDLNTDPDQSDNGYSGLSDERKAELAARLDALKNCARDACRAAEDISTPETNIVPRDTGAVSLTNSTNASFSFNSNEPGSTFQCSLDSAIEYSSCTSPKTYSGLPGNTQHVFRVKAVDVTGDADPSPAVHTWTIDTEEPDTRITGGPSSSTNDATPTFAFSGSDNLTTTTNLRYSFKVDGDEWSPFSSSTSATLGNPGGLSDGSHTFSVRVKDQAGNVDSSPAERTFNVDTTPPQTNILDTDTGAVSLTNSTNASFSFNSNESGATFECSLDSAPSFTSCTSPKTYSGLAGNRQHTFRVRAVDETGFEDPSPAVHTWTIDTEGPGTSINGGPSGSTADRTPTFAFSGSDNLTTTANLRYSFKVDGDEWSPFSSSTSATLGGPDGLSDGSHTFSVKSRDQAGNEDSTPAERTFTVDTTVPDAPVIDSPREGRLVASVFIVSGTAEAGSTVELFEGSSPRGTATAGTSGNWSIRLSGVSEGSHTYTATATDAAGRTSAASDPRTVIVDSTKPRVERAVPGENARGVDPGVDIEVFFSEAMRASTINGSTVKLFKVGATTPLIATVSYDAATKKATLNPTNPLGRGKRYKGVVSTEARDEVGNYLDQIPSENGLQTKSWFFTVKG